MVGKRCILAAEHIFEKAQITVLQAGLGQITVYKQSLTAEKLAKVDEVLREYGLERISHLKSTIPDQIKGFVTEHIYSGELTESKYKWSALLEQYFGYDYDYLSRLFSKTNDSTLEQFIIRQKIEKAKSLLLNTHLRIKEIAHCLGYKSTPHLSAQFRKVTGNTLSDYRRTYSS